MTDSVPTLPNAAATFSDQRTQSVIANRSHVPISPKYGGRFKQGEIIRIELPSQDWLDPDLFSINFTAEIFQADGRTIPPYGTAYGEDPLSAGSSRFCRFDTPSHLMFSRVKLIQGSTVLEDITDYGTLVKALSLSTVNRPYLETLGSALEGHYDPKDYDQVADAKRRQAWGDTEWALGAAQAAEGNVAGLNKGWKYNIRPLLGLLRAGKYLPLKWMGTLVIELHLEQNNRCLISSTSVETDIGAKTFTEQTGGGGVAYAAGTVEVPNPTREADFPGAYYIISNVNAQCHFVQPIEEYDRTALALIEEKGMEIWYDTFSTHNRLLTGSGKNTNSFQERAVSLKGGFAVLQNNEDILDIRTPVTFPDNHMEEFQWKVGSQYHPAQAVDCRYGSGLALGTLQNTFDAFGDLGTSGTIDGHNFTGPRIYTDAGVTAITDVGHTLDGTVNVSGTTTRAREIFNESSLPNSFIMALNLEKSPDQLSGFNSAAAGVDVELITRTIAANSTDLNIGPGRDNSVLSAGHTFQPSKFLVHHAYKNNAGDARPAATTSDRNQTSERPSLLKEMHTKTPSKNCQITFFAHIDSVLKIQRVGTVSVMR